MKRASLALLALVALVPVARAAADYHQAKKITIPGEATYYDYVYFDEVGRRLYVTFGGDVVMVDPEAGKVVGKLEGQKKVHGVALAEGKVFVSDGGANAVVVHDGKTGKVLAQVKAGANPDAIIYDPASKQILAFNHSGGTVTMIDPTTLKETATIEVGGALEFGRADGKGTVWVNAEDKSELIRLDTKKRTVTARWKLSPCDGPTGLAFDAKNRRLFAGCTNGTMAVVDADSGKVITTLPIGEDVDATAYDPATGDIFNSCGGGKGSVVVIHQESADKYSVAQTLPIGARSKTLTLDPKTHRVFVTAASFTTPAAATPANPKPRASMVPGSFGLLVFEK